MKRLFTALFFGMLATAASAQTLSPCGTGFDESQKQLLLDYAKNGRGAAAKSAVLYYVPLYLHIVGDSSGNGYFGAHQLMNDICQLNSQYVPVGFYFYLAGVEYIANTSYYNHPQYNAGYDMMYKYNRPNAANVYIVSNPAGNCGYFSPFRNAVALGKSCMGDRATTWAHEMGHFFSLPHPFDNVTGSLEYVDGTNCDWGGDLFCDTRADYLNYRWQCPYNGSKTDPNGDPYDPDGTLYMSYSNDACANRFSLEQIDAMHYNITTASNRINLQGPVQDTMPNMQRVSRALPLQGMPVNTNNATFTWNKVPGAKWYVFQVSRVSPAFPSSMPVNIITADTFYKIPAGDLTNNLNHYWRVRPIYAGRTCTEFSDTGHFFTSSSTGIADLYANESLNLYPNPSTGSQVFLSFEYGATDHVTATITTLDGKQLPASVARYNTHAYTLDVTGLKAGFYIIDVTNGDRTYRRKLLVE